MGSKSSVLFKVTKPYDKNKRASLLGGGGGGGVVMPVCIQMTINVLNGCEYMKSIYLNCE